MSDEGINYRSLASVLDLILCSQQVEVLLYHTHAILGMCLYLHRKEMGAEQRGVPNNKLQINIHFWCAIFAWISLRRDSATES